MSKHHIINLPNCLTLLRIALTPLFLLMLFADLWYWKSMAFVVFVVASLTDFFDGRLARSGNQVTSFGRFLDPLADKILVTSALIAFVFDQMVNLWLVIPIVMRDILITILRLYGIYHGRQMVTSRFAKWKTVVQLFTVVFLLFIIGLQETLGRFSGDGAFFLDGARIQILANGLMVAVLLLTILSGCHYFSRSGFFYKES
ncbi:MAG: CDP-diacylglycerol--glycerol-3-phosphate 3-phosphatidyltransferase [Gemmatimonadetes bacterium]|jgi:CDP-diacylglycerol---glycerol-3-phosphate 3-phosphatidyltransferase|nr:CDP-diacylglycerol--glycerol-3-phosphate 3-phosphatidyltransferase [Gemmatimonadota bacterium]